MSLSSAIKSALTTFLGDSLSTSSDGLFWDEVCSTFSDPLFASKLQSDEDNLGNQDKFKDLERINRRLLVEKRQLVHNTRDLRAGNTALKNRVVCLESEIARLAAALSCEQRSRQSSSLQSELNLKRKHREELQEENKRYKKKLQESERLIKMLTTQRKPFMEVERQNGKSDDCGCTPARPARHIQQYHPDDELWQVDYMRHASFLS